MIHHFSMQMGKFGSLDAVVLHHHSITHSVMVGCHVLEFIWLGRKSTAGQSAWQCG